MHPYCEHLQINPIYLGLQNKKIDGKFIFNSTVEFINNSKTYNHKIKKRAPKVLIFSCFDYLLTSADAVTCSS